MDVQSMHAPAEKDQLALARRVIRLADTAQRSVRPPRRSHAMLTYVRGRARAKERPVRSCLPAITFQRQQLGLPRARAAIDAAIGARPDQRASPRTVFYGLCHLITP